MAEEVIAIVPAGGRSRRLAAAVAAGGKAAVVLDGESLLGRVCRAVASEAGRVIVVAAAGQPLPPLEAAVEVVRDSQPDRGPLAAVRDGLLHALARGARPRVALVASCDLPDLAPAVVRLLVERARRPGVSWVVPIVGGHPQVLVSALAGSLLETLAAGTGTPASPRELLEAVATADPAGVVRLPEPELVAVDPTLASFADIDTPADLRRRERMIARRLPS